MLPRLQQLSESVSACSTLPGSYSRVVGKKPQDVGACGGTKALAVACTAAVTITSFLVFRRRHKGCSQPLVRRARGGEFAESLPVRGTQGAINAATLDSALNELAALEVIKSIREALVAAHSKLDETTTVEDQFVAMLSEPLVARALVAVSRLSSRQMSAIHARHPNVLDALKQLKHFWDLAPCQISFIFARLARQVEGPMLAAHFDEFAEKLDLCGSSDHWTLFQDVANELPQKMRSVYEQKSKLRPT